MYRVSDFIDYLKNANFVPLIIILVVVTIVLIITRRGQNEDTSSNNEPTISNEFTSMEFKKEVFSIYSSIQKVFSDYNVEKIRLLLTNNFYNELLEKIEEIKNSKDKPIYENIIMKKINTESVTKIPKGFKIDVTASVLCKEYLIDENNNKVEKYKNEYTEQMLKMSFVKQSIEESNIKCPNCGSDLKSNICDNCKTTVIFSGSNLYLNELNILSEKSIPFKERNYLEGNPRKEEIFDGYKLLIEVLKMFSEGNIEKITNEVTTEVLNTLTEEKKYLDQKGQKYIIENPEFINGESLSNLQSKNNAARVYITSNDYVINNKGEIIRGSKDEKITIVYEIEIDKETSKLSSIKLISQKKI